MIGGKRFAEISNIGNSVKAEESLNYTAEKEFEARSPWFEHRKSIGAGACPA